MPTHSRLAIFARVVLLPLALALGTVVGLGSYTETNDDPTLAGLFAGVLALKPVPSVPLYFHGYGHVLAAAYAAAPGVPWLGLLLGGLLAGASILCFAVLDKLFRPHLRSGPLALVLGLFFGLAWLEHWLLFSHVRVALLLAGSAVLFAAQRPGRTGPLLLGLVSLGAAWLLRPSLAVLAFGAVLPAAILLAGSWRRAAPVLLSATLGLALAAGMAAWQRTPAEARTQQRDAYFARILDFEQLRSRPRTPADSLGTAALGLWIMGDSTVVNAAFCRRAYYFEPTDFFGREVPGKLLLRAGLLVRDYFPLLLALATMAVIIKRRRAASTWFWLVQLGFSGLMTVLAGIFKLPPRIELPLLDFWILTNLIFWLKLTFEGRADAFAPVAPSLTSSFLVFARFRWLSLAVGLATVGFYAAKTWHRRIVLGQESRRHETALATLRQLGSGQIKIMAGTNDWLKSLSPFRVYPVGPGPVLLLTGWNSHDASQAPLRQALAGSADQTACLRHLATLPNHGPAAQTLWVLTPETAAWLSRRFRLVGSHLLLRPKAGVAPFSPDSPARVYEVQSGLKP